DWGDGNISTGLTAANFPLTHTYTQLGAFNLAVTGFGANGCNYTKTYVVANQSNPAGSLGTLGSTINLCAPALVPFTIGNWQINSPGTIYVLDFGDGTSVTLTHPLNATLTNDTVYHTYTTSSCPASPSFTATLSVINACDVTPYTAGNIQVRIKPTAEFTATPNPVCVGNSICFNNTTTLGSYGPSCNTTATYLWDFGDGSPTSTSVSPCHIYTNPGTYTVTLTATNPCGSTTFTREICVTTAPTPSFTLDNAEGCIPFTTTVTNTSDNHGNICAPLTYSWTVTYVADYCGTAPAWTFTGGTNNASENPSFQFTNPGRYIIRLSITNPCGTFTTTQTVNVKRPPLVTLNPVAGGCGAITVSPTAVVQSCATGALTYAWTFTGGSPSSSTDANPGPVTFATPGANNISLTVTNECGPTTVNLPIVVSSVTLADAGVDQNLCGSSTQLAANNPTPGTGAWSQASGPGTAVFTNPADPNTTVTNLIPGTYVFTWTITNGTCVLSDNVTVIIAPGPTNAAAGPDQSLCLTSSVTLAANTPTVGVGNWTYVIGPAGYTITDPTLPNTTVTGLTNGVYVFRWTTTFSTCVPSTDDVQITITDYPSNALAGPDQTICASIATLAANTPAIGIGTWTTISGPNTPVITSINNPSTTVTGLNSGTYLFKWEIASGNCPATSDTVAITITTPLTAPLAGADQEVCALNVLTMTANTITVGTGSWSYVSGPAGYSITDASSPTTTITGLVPGVYVFRWSVTNGICPAIFDDVQLTINASASTAAAGNDQNTCAQSVLLAANTPTVGNGTWTYVSGPAGYVITNPALPNTTVTGLVPGIYVFRWTIANGTCTSTDDVTITIQSGATPAAAGSDQNLCLANSVTLAANTPTVGTGLWSYVSGPVGYTITNSTLPNTTVTGLVPGVYTFRWTTSFSTCTPNSDDIQITIYANPTVAVVGADQIVCTDSVIVNANTPTSGTGTWFYVSGPVGSAITAPSLTTTSIRNLLPGVYRFRWTISNGNCNNSSDTIQVTVLPYITNNIITAPLNVCINTQPSIVLGTTPSGGNGTYTYQWQNSNNGTTWNNILGEVNSTYQPPILTIAGAYYYRRLVFSGNCSSISNADTINVRNDAQAQITANPLTGCAPFNLSPSITVTPFSDRNGQYLWYADGASIGNNTTGVFPGYTINNPADTVEIKLVTLSQYGCKSDTTSAIFNTIITVQAAFAKDTSFGCSPLPVTFVNTSSIINNTVQFFWNFGNGVTSTLAQPGTIVFNQSADYRDTTYRIVLKAFNGCDTTQYIDSVRIRSNPKARIGVDTTFGCSPFTVHVNNTSLGGPSTYYWDFGNGHLDTTYTTGALTYTYNVGNVIDTFTIRLIAVNECARDTQTVDIRIAPNTIVPAINVPASALFGCAPHAVSFNNATTGASAFTWNFGDGSAVTQTTNGQSSIVHTYNLPGTYTVSIAMANGCSDTIVYRQVVVYPKPSAAFTLNRTLFCTGDTVKVTNASVNATSYQWFWGDGTSTSGFNPTHTYATAGNYTIVLHAQRSNNNGVVCFDTLARSVTVYAQPVVTVQSNINAANCAPFTLNASAPGLLNEPFTWELYDSTATPSIITFTTNSIQYTFNRPGTFYIKLRASNASGCADSTRIPFTVRIKPSASFTPSTVTTCRLDTTVSFSNTSSYTGTDVLTYRWLVNGMSFSTASNFTHTYTAIPNAVYPQLFTTSLVVSNAAGCSDTANGRLLIQPSSKAQFGITNPNLCVPYRLNVSNTSQYATIYKWLLNGVLVSTNAQPDIDITQPGTAYTVTLITGNALGCKPDTTAFSFVSRQGPIAAFRVNDTLSCSGSLNVVTNNTTTNGISYTWNWGDGSANSSFAAPTHLYSSAGQYIITLIASDGLCIDTTEHIVRVTQGPKADFQADDPVVCGPVNITFVNLSLRANSYLWSFSDGTTSTDLNPIKSFTPRPTPYSVKLVVTGDYNCKDSLVKANLVYAKVPPVADFYISPTPTISIPNYTFTFNNLTLNNSTYRYLWSLGDGSFARTRDVVRRYSDTGSYPIQLIVVDTVTNCTDTVNKVARIQGFPGWLYVPNAICPSCVEPNLRGFLPKGTGLEKYKLQIFTTWGELVYETTGLDANGAPNQPWDARYKGAIVQQDVYVWKIEAKFRNGSEWKGMNYPGDSKPKKTGTVTVVK
ncbi:MAG: PKD domain-containing protein, partial [Ferruginibacter sp.]